MFEGLRVGKFDDIFDEENGNRSIQIYSNSQSNVRIRKPVRHWTTTVLGSITFHSTFRRTLQVKTNCVCISSYPDDNCDMYPKNI